MIPNNEEQFKKLSQKLGLDFEQETTDLEPDSNGTFQAVVPTVTSNTALAPITVANRDSDEEQDYQKVRKNYDLLAQVGNQAVADLLAIARITSEPRAYEVVATLIKSLNETNKNLYGIHEESKRTKETSKLAHNNEQTGIVNHIDKAVFVGQQSDLLTKINPTLENNE